MYILSAKSKAVSFQIPRVGFFYLRRGKPMIDQAKAIDEAKLHPESLSRQNESPLYDQLVDPLTPQSLDCLSFCKYEALIDIKPFHLTEDFDFGYFRIRKEKNAFSSQAGYLKTRSITPDVDHFINNSSTSTDDLSRKPWIMEYFIKECSEHYSKWWEFVIPSLLNFLRSVDIKDRIHGAQLVQLLTKSVPQQLLRSGLIPVFEEHVEPLLSFLPPLEDTATTMRVHQPAIICLAELAELQPQLSRNKRLNYIARHGTLKPFGKRSGDVEYLCEMLRTLELFISKYLESLTIIHFNVIVKVFNQIMADPFVRISKVLISHTESMMIAAMKWSWPVVARYRLDIMYGLTKGQILNSECFKMLDPTDEEIETLRNIKIIDRNNDS